METEDSLLEIGKVVKPHGVKGKVRIIYYGDSPETLTSAPYLLVKKEGKSSNLTVLTSTAYKKHYIVHFETINSFEQAQALVGACVYIRKSHLPSLPEDEYYWFELIGCEVVLENGPVVGTLSQIVPTGSNDVYVVSQEKGEVLIPATVEAVKEIDTRAKRIIVYPLEEVVDNDFV